MTYQNTPIVPLSNIYMNGLGFLANNNLSILQVFPGQCYDSTNTYPIISNTTILPDISKHGANGLDTGTVAASTFYYVHIISDPSLQNYTKPEILFSLSKNAPILPTGYGIFRRIGVIKTDTDSTILEFTQSGNGSSRLYLWEQPISVLTSGHAVTATTVNVIAGVPILHDAGNYENQVILNLQYIGATAGNAGALKETGNQASTLSTYPIVVSAQVATVAVHENQVTLICDNTTTAINVDYIVTNASDALSLQVAGFVDALQ